MTDADRDEGDHRGGVDDQRAVGTTHYSTHLAKNIGLTHSIDNLCV